MYTENTRGAHAATNERTTTMNAFDYAAAAADSAAAAERDAYQTYCLGFTADANAKIATAKAAHTLDAYDVRDADDASEAANEVAKHVEAADLAAAYARGAAAYALEAAENKDAEAAAKYAADAAAEANEAAAARRAALSVIDIFA